MTIGEKAEQKAVNQILLAHDNVSNLLAQCRNPLAQLAHLSRNFLRRFHVRDETCIAQRMFDQIAGATKVKTVTTLSNRPVDRVFRSRCPLHRKRESQHRVNGCRIAHSRLHC